MSAVVKGLPQDIQDKIEVREWSLRTREGVARFRELGGPKIPALAIQEQLVFEAEIPATEQLISAIEMAR